MRSQPFFIKLNAIQQLLTVLIIAAVNPAMANESPAKDHNACLRCHAMTTLAYRDLDRNKIVNLSIDSQALAHSVHGKLSCVECHDGEFDRYPHQVDAQNPPLSCVSCHEEKDDAAERHYQFTTIEAEYKQSVHATSDAPEAEGFNCHSCHNPHQFRASQVGEPLANIIHADNQLCLSCHELARARHAWLPNQEKHWQAVRCLDCHTPLSENGQTVSHQILKAEASNHDCVNCHSKDSRLLNRLYQYRAATNLEHHGWINTAVFNEAYVVGMSRSPLLDRLALGVIGLTLLVLLAHGIGRYKAYQKVTRNRT
ncbi:nitrate reductase [Chromatium okenii]|uniref:nitrate reductase n=1 Tax=Chromatium okenii TaxID=61644 RepID=UPI0026EDB5D3|nr:nitrate reductase [Chromatium okenii]